MKKPNFFILGAPKCGTTSLASWLSEHRNIFLSKPKEPRFFSKDYNAPGCPKSLQEYEKLFDEVTNEHKAVGEATTIYLRSSVAVSEILQYSQTVRFIVCLRSPIEMVPSVHAQLVKMGTENLVDFEQAWNMQKIRTEGKHVPLLCPDKKVLLYGRECLLGQQMARLYQLVPREKVHVIFLEDMKADAGKEYRRVLSFLGVDDDGRQHFPVENARAVPRFPIIAQAIRVAGLVKVRLGLKKNWGLGSIVYRLNNHAPKKSSLSPEMKENLKVFFKDDIQLLAELSGRDLSHWIKD